MIDPRHPDEATVFALVVGPRELDDLRHQLRVALDDRVEETNIQPEVVTQLADIGHVEAFSAAAGGRDGHPARRLGHPGWGRGRRRSKPAEAPPPTDGPSQPKAPRPPTPEQERSRPDADRAVAARTDPPIVVLVWVTGLIRVDRPRPTSADGAASIVFDVTVACRPGI